MSYMKTILMNLLILLTSVGFSQDFKLLTPPVLDLGTVRSDTIAKGVIRFKNVGDQPIKIKNIRTSCGCTVVKPAKYTYQPQEEGELPVRFNAKGYNGTTRKTVNIYLEKGKPSPVRVIVQTTVQPRIGIEPRFLNMQNVLLSEGKKERKFKVVNNMDKVLVGHIGSIKNDRLKVKPIEFRIIPGKMQEFKVIYTPEEAGRDDGYLVFEFSQPKVEKKRMPLFINVSP